MIKQLINGIKYEFIYDENSYVAIIEEHYNTVLNQHKTVLL